MLARQENQPHALLIEGPRGIGKLALARLFAQITLCESPRADQPCQHCEGCRWFLAGQHPDYRQIEPEALAGPQFAPEDAPAAVSKSAKPSHEIKIAQVRQLTDFLNIGSHRGRRRIALFHPAESMNANAANSLLKSLEDPPQGAAFILITNSKMQLLPTIRSRCVCVSMGVPERRQGLAWLEQEQVENAQDWLAYSGGAPLLAQELADSGRGPQIMQLITLLRKGGKASLENWPANSREDLEVLSEVLQKWAYDQVLAEFSRESNFCMSSIPKAGSQSRHRAEWMRFARLAGHYRIAAGHPLNPKLFASDLISRMPA